MHLWDVMEAMASSGEEGMSEAWAQLAATWVQMEILGSRCQSQRASPSSTSFTVFDVVVLDVLVPLLLSSNYDQKLRT